MNAVLQRIRESLAQAHLPAAMAMLPPRPAYETTQPVAAMVAAFGQNLEPIRGRVSGPLGPDAATEQVVALLTAAGAGEVLSWALDQIDLPGLAPALAAAGVRCVDAHVPNDPDGHAEALQRLARVPAGLTGADAGLADTASLVLAHGPGRPRLASLLPPVHIAVLPVSRLVPGLPVYLATHPGALAASSNVVIVTGPSRTADIELIPVFGVHGPKRLEVVLVDDAEG
jgi:L-lactate dehydrogenase complex protein LldG